MKKIVYTTFVALFLFILPSFASAHLLTTDRNIGGVFHIEPDDDPIVGKMAFFAIEIKDKTNKFTASTCQCTVKIIEGGNTVYSKDIVSPPSESTLTFSYIFPKKDIYSVVISGKPKADKAFQEFSLTDDLRVSRQEQPIAPSDSIGGANKTSDFISSHLIHFGIGAAIILIGIFLSVIKRIEHVKKAKASQGIASQASSQTLAPSQSTISPPNQSAQTNTLPNLQDKEVKNT